MPGTLVGARIHQRMGQATTLALRELTAQFREGPCGQQIQSIRANHKETSDLSELEDNLQK